MVRRAAGYQFKSKCDVNDSLASIMRQGCAHRIPWAVLSVTFAAVFTAFRIV